TMAKVKNAALAEGDKAEPVERVLGEEQVVASSDQLIANTDKEARELVELYGADPARVATVSPGVDLSLFRPESPLLARGAGLLPHRTGPARRRLGLPRDAYVLLFVGRIQPLKAPDVLLRAVARMLDDDPALRAKLVVAVVGGPSGSGRCRPEGLQNLAAELGITDVMRFEPPSPQQELAAWYRAADVTVVPSHSESFGLVAVESQACGTPVVASRVGGLCTAVADGESGVLIPGHDPADYAAVLRRLYAEPGLHARLARGAVRHGPSFGWDATVDDRLEVYTGAMSIPAGGVAAPAVVSARTVPGGAGEVRRGRQGAAEGRGAGVRGTARGRVLRQAPGAAEARHHDVAHRRRAQPARRGVLLPPPRREPRRVLPLPPGEERPHVRGRLRLGRGR